MIVADTIGFDLVTTAPSDSDRQAAVELGLLRPADAEFDGAIINARSKVRVMRVAVDARLRRLEPFGTPNLVFVPRSDLAALVAISSRSASAFCVEVRSGVVTAMDERYHP